MIGEGKDFFKYKKTKVVSKRDSNTTVVVVLGKVQIDSLHFLIRVPPITSHIKLGLSLFIALGVPSLNFLQTVRRLTEKPEQLRQESSGQGLWKNRVLSKV